MLGAPAIERDDPTRCRATRRGPRAGAQRAPLLAYSASTGAEGIYEYAHVDLERGGVPVGNCGTSRHLAESEGPFGVIVWGTDLYASYGYPAGSDISKINEVELPVPQ